MTYFDNIELERYMTSCPSTIGNGSQRNDPTNKQTNEPTSSPLILSQPAENTNGFVWNTWICWRGCFFVPNGKSTTVLGDLLFGLFIFWSFLKQTQENGVPNSMDFITVFSHSNGHAAWVSGSTFHWLPRKIPRCSIIYWRTSWFVDGYIPTQTSYPKYISQWYPHISWLDPNLPQLNIFKQAISWY